MEKQPGNHFRAIRAVTPRVLLALAVSLSLVGISVRDAHALTYVVSSLADSGAGSLRQALLDANAHAGPDAITFSVSGTIAIISDLPYIAEDLGINASGQSITLSASGTSQVLSINASKIVTLNALTITNSTASSYGVYNGGSTIVMNSTFTGNAGVGIENEGTLTVFNSTFYGNAGGGISNSATLTVNNSTFSGNAGTGIDNEGGTLYLKNSILANSGAWDCYSTVAPITDIHNLIENSYGCGTPVITADPVLGALANNGGYTRTMALDPTSPAIGAGDNATCATTDQRGITRPQGTTCDIGAYEYQLPPVLHAKTSGVASGDCDSWVHACLLRYALSIAASGEQIWTAAGTYTPGATRSDTFTLKTGVAVYGGFTGTETLLGQRNPAAHVTTLSGEIGAVGIDDNSYHVVTGSGTDSTAVLDGFTVTAGNASESAYPDNYGAGMFSEAGSPSLANVIFSSNTALDGGGGIYNEAGRPSLTNITFSGNSGGSGGGMSNYDGSNPVLMSVIFGGNAASPIGGVGGGMANFNGSNPILNDVTFHGNSASGGGGMSNTDSSPSLTNVSFDSNTSNDSGGGMYNWNSSPALRDTGFDENTASLRGGGMYNANSSPILTKVTFHGNTSDNWGGGMFNTSSSAPQLTNATFAGNTAISSGGGMWNNSSSPIVTNVTFNGNSAEFGGGMFNQDGSNAVVKNSIFWGDGTEIINFGGSSTPLVSYSLIQGGCPASASCSGTILNTDPFLAALANNGGLTETMALGPGSPAIDAGNDATCAGTDQRGIPRPQGPHCDMGAYEYAFKNIEVKVAGSTVGSHLIGLLHGEEHSYTGINGGPARVSNTDGSSVVSSIRVLYGANSYSEMMGYPNNTTTEFWFPWYNNTAMDSQFRVSNLGASSTTITVSLGGSTIDSFSLGVGAAIRKNYPGQNNGPMHVSSSGGMPILATIRVLYGGSSFTEMMGYPSNTTTEFWFPWYNNTAMDSQFRVSNLGGSSTTITVYLGASPIDSFSLGAGAAIRKNYAGQNNGPMHVTSSGGMPILATIRVVWGSSFSEMMGFPNNTTGEFWFPWYDNVGTDAQLRVSNLGGSATTIKVYLAEGQIDSFTLGAGAAVRKNYAGLNDGGLHVTSNGGMPILATARLLYAGTSFYELMGYSGNALTSTQYFPWYNNTAMDSQLRFTTVP